MHYAIVRVEVNISTLDLTHDITICMTWLLTVPACVETTTFDLQGLDALTRVRLCLHF